MGKFLRIHLPFARAGIQETVTYRTNFIFFILGDILNCFILYFLWIAVFNSSGEGAFKGFTMEDMVLYIFISFLTGFLTHSSSTYVIADEIRDGSISMRIIKPIKFEMPFLFQELGNTVMTIYLVFIPCLLGVEIYRFVITGAVQFQILWFLLYVVSTFLAYLISFYFNVCYGFTAFIFKNQWGSKLLRDCIVGFVSGATVPLHFLPAAVSNVLQILPFASLSYTPVMIYMGKYELSHVLYLLLLQVVWLIFFVVLSKIIWRLVMKHLCVQGG